jgi:hypothetical protein
MLLTKSCESAVDLLKIRRDDLLKMIADSALPGEADPAAEGAREQNKAYWMVGYVVAMNDVLALFGQLGQRKP